MVRLHTSLLAITLATGSALASSSSNEYPSHRELDFNNQVQSREFVQGEAVPYRRFRFGRACAGAFGQNNLQSRGFEDKDDLFVRDLDAYDGLEAREPSRVGEAVKFGKMVATHKRTKKLATGVNRVATGVAVGQEIVNTLQSRGFEDEEDRFVRDLDAYDGLEAREPSRVGEAIKFGKMVATHKRTKKIATGVNRVATGVAVGQEIVNTLQSRGLEEYEDLFGRDLDAEELYGREYDLFDERDTIDDLD